MKANIIRKVGCLVILFAIVVPMAVADNRSKCSPTEWDFGDVSIGSSSTVIFTLTNFDETEIAIRNIWIVNATSDSFRIHIDVPPPSIYIPNENSYDIIVEFSPSSLGDHSAELRISTNTKVSDVFIPVQGMGVIEEVPPVEPMAHLIDSFNEFVEKETIKFSGHGHLVSCRMKAFGSMLKASSDLINVCDYESACTQLRDALNRIDGDKHPPDFMEGLNTETLASMIRDVINLLECLKQ
ncbi:MAG: choice-of-anchor D domain-containing protein [Desulfobacterales bacterium]